MYFKPSASGYNKIDNFYTNEILPFGPSNIGSNSSPFENGYFNNLILGNVSSNNFILSNLTSENLRFTNGTGNNLIVNNTINSNTISSGNLFFTNGTGNNLRINNTINSNTVSTGNIFNTNITSNLLHINNRINLSNTQQSISQIPLFVQPPNDVNFLVVSAGGGGSFSVKRSGIIFGRERSDLSSYRIENAGSGLLEFYHGVNNAVNLSTGSLILSLNNTRLSTGNIVNTNTTLTNLLSTSITTNNIDITRGGVNLLTANFQTVNNLQVNNTINSFSLSSGSIITNDALINNSTITNLLNSNISSSNISSSNLLSTNAGFTNATISNSTINSLRMNNFNAPIIYSSGNLALNIDNTSLKVDDGILEIGNIGTYLRGIKGVQTLNATLMLQEINDYFGFTVYDNVEDLTDTLGVKLDAVFINTFINEDHFKFGNGFPFSYVPPFPLELKLPSANQICFIRDNKLTGDNSLKFNQANQSCTIENLEGEHIDYRDASFTYITSGNIRSTNLLYGPNLYVNNLHSCANATMTNLKVNNVLTFDSIQGDLISTKNMLLVNITCSNIKANNKITSDVLDSQIISAGSILTNHISSSNLRINTTASINNLQCEVAFIGGMSVGNATMNNLRILQGMTCESIKANDTINSLTFSSANLFNQTATMGNIEFNNIRQNPFGHSTFSNMRILSTLGSAVISCGNLWTDNTISSRVLSVADLFSINSTMDNLKVNSIGSITLLSSGNIFNDNTISSNAISCSNLWCNGTISSRTLSLTNLFSINGTMDNLKVNSIGSFGLISCGSLFTDNTLSSTAISTNNIFANNITLGSLRINNHATIDNLLATNITITNAVPRITLRDTQASTDAEVVCRGYLKDLNSWISGELGSNMMLSSGKLKADLQAVPFGGIQITDDKNIRIEAIKMTQWDGYNARISACETGVAASGALITFLNTTPIPNGLQVGAPQYFIYLNTFCIANAASATTALGVGSDALAKVNAISSGSVDLAIPTLNSININTTNFSASNISTSNVILNGTSLNTILTDTNTSINNINSSISSLSFPQNTAPSNFIATTLTTTNLQLNGSSLNTIITGITSPSNLIATNLTTTNLQLNGSSLNTVITGITSPSNLIATNLTTTNLRIQEELYVGPENGAGRIFLGGGTVGDTGFDHSVIETRNYSGNEMTEMLLFKGNDTGNVDPGPDRIRLRAGLLAFDTYDVNTTNRSAENIRMSINSDGVVSCGNFNSTNLTTTNLQLNGSSLNTILTNTFTSINNLSALTSANLSNISSSNICAGNIFTTNLTTLNLAITNTAGDNIVRMNCSNVGGASNTFIFDAVDNPRYSDLYFNTNGSVNFRQKGDGSYPSRFSIDPSGNVGIGTNNTAGVNLNVNNPSGTCRVRASGPYSAQQGFGLFDTTNNQESWSIIREGNQDNLIIYRNSATMTFNMTPSGNLGLIGSLSCGNLRTSAITCSNLVISSGNTRLEFVVGNRGSSSVEGWTTLDPNGGSSNGLFIWDALEVGGPITCSNLFTPNARFTNLSSTNLLMRGASNTITGPHINIFQDAVNHQTYQQLNWNSDNISQAYNGYWDGSNWKRASGNACFQIYKLNGRLEFNFDGPAGVAGDTISWQNSYAITNTGIVSGASFQLTNLAGLNNTLSNSILNNSTINNLMIPSGTNSSITLGNSFIQSRISAGTASTYRHFKQSRIVQKGSASIGNLDIEEAEVLALDPSGINQTCFLPNVLTNIPLNYSGEFIIRHNGSSFDITLSTIANGSFIYPINQQIILTAGQFAKLHFVKTGNTTATYYVNKSTA